MAFSFSLIFLQGNFNHILANSRIVNDKGSIQGYYKRVSNQTKHVNFRGDLQITNQTCNVLGCNQIPVIRFLNGEVHYGDKCILHISTSNQVGVQRNTIEGTRNESGLKGFKIGGKTYVKPTIKNLIFCLNSSTEKWKGSMEQFDFSNRGFDAGCTYFSSGADLNGVFTIRRCPNKTISISWITIGSNKSAILDDLSYELEAYYKETDDDGGNVYAFTDDEFIYLFKIYRTNTSELILLARYDK